MAINNSSKAPFFLWPSISTGFAAEIAIMAVYLLWGLNFTATKVCLEYTSPLVFSSLSFAAGGLVVICQLYKNLRWCDWEGAFVVGLCMCVSSAMQAFALNHTLVAKTAFYSTLDIPITAIMELNTRYLDKGEIFGVFCSVIGAFLLSWNGVSVAPNLGDWFSILACIPSSIYFIACAHYTTPDSKASLCIGQLVVTAIVCGALAPVLETPVFTLDWRLLFGLIITGCLSCGAALFVLTWAQMFTTPTRAVIIGAPEPVFAAIIAYLLYGEQFDSLWNIIGALFLLLGLISPAIFPVEKLLEPHDDN